mgnify:CR=1 FL=1
MYYVVENDEDIQDGTRDVVISDPIEEGNEERFEFVAGWSVWTYDKCELKFSLHTHVRHHMGIMEKDCERGHIKRVHFKIDSQAARTQRLEKNGPHEMATDDNGDRMGTTLNETPEATEKSATNQRDRTLGSGHRALR